MLELVYHNCPPIIVVDCTTPKQCDMLVTIIWHPVERVESADITLIENGDRDSLYFKEYNIRIETLVNTLSGMVLNFDLYSAVIVGDMRISCNNFQYLTDEEKTTNEDFLLADNMFGSVLYKKNITRIDFIRKEEGKFLLSPDGTTEELPSLLALNWRTTQVVVCRSCGWEHIPKISEFDKKSKRGRK